MSLERPSSIALPQATAERMRIWAPLLNTAASSSPPEPLNAATKPYLTTAALVNQDAVSAPRVVAEYLPLGAGDPLGGLVNATASVSAIIKRPQ